SAAPRRQVSQSCGSMTRATRRALTGSCCTSQRSLVTVKDALGTLPVCSAHHCAPPNSATRSAAAADERRSFHSSAGLITAPSASSTSMPCCWPATATAAARSSRPLPACSRAAHQACGSHSVPAGWGALPVPTTVPSSARHSTTFVDCVEESIPATSVTGLSPPDAHVDLSFPQLLRCPTLQGHAQPVRHASQTDLGRLEALLAERSKLQE